jgi:hypothetical protein
VQFQYVAVGDAMIWSYLLTIECSAPPESCEHERPSDILVHEPGDIGHRVTPANDEWTCSVGWMARRLRVHAYDAQRAEHKWRESLERVAALRRDSEGGKSHTGELFKHAHFVGTWIQITLVRD